MGLQKLVANYSAYNAWANTQLLEWLQALPVEQLYAQVPSSFTSIDYTLQHMLRVQRFWLAFICGDDLSALNWNVHEHKASVIMAELAEQSAAMKLAFAAFTEEQLEEVLTLDMPWAKNRLSRYEYIIHVVNHSTFHRGQVVTIARGLGINDNIPQTDYNIFNCIP